MIPPFTDGFFKVSPEHGFLPIQDPIPFLPEPFDAVQRIIDSLPSLLRQGALAERLDDLPDLTVLIRDALPDRRLAAALFRAYCFLTSAYLLEPAYHTFLTTGRYGRGRDRLSIQLSSPLQVLADSLEVFPFLEYSFGYSLGNYVRKEPSGTLEVENLKMACSFTGTNDEIGFIMDHVDINRHSPRLIYWAGELLHTHGEEAIQGLRDVVRDMNKSRQKMWSVSRADRYNDFRVFIMGIAGNTSIFPRGVIYEPETEPRYYRGQSGSQDTIIPFLDTLLRINDYYPDNDLTRYLLDMRNYRPKPFRDLLVWTEAASEGLIAKLTDTVEKCGLLFDLFSEVYRFRNGHWQFVQEYIMKNTDYPIATGGTPIISWLPNQIEATLQASRDILEVLDHSHPMYQELNAQQKQREDLLREQRYCLSQRMSWGHRETVDRVVGLNETFHQKDQELPQGDVPGCPFSTCAQST